MGKSDSHYCSSHFADKNLPGGSLACEYTAGLEGIGQFFYGLIRESRFYAVDGIHARFLQI